MSEALAHLIAHEHWPYVWPCYALAALIFGTLTWRAFARLRYWKKRADDEGA